MTSLIEKSAQEVLAPIAGQITNIATTGGTAGSIDLSMCGPTTMSMGNEDALPPDNYDSTGAGNAGAINRYAEIFADGADAGVLFGASNAAVTGSNAASLSTTGTSAAGVTLRIPSGTYRTFLIRKSTRWMGYIQSTNSNIRISVTSRLT